MLEAERGSGEQRGRWGEGWTDEAGEGEGVAGPVLGAGAVARRRRAEGGCGRKLGGLGVALGGGAPPAEASVSGFGKSDLTHLGRLWLGSSQSWVRDGCRCVRNG